MLSRVFTIETLRHFQIGYSPETRTVTVPVHSFYGEPMGLVGRAIEGKQFRNTKGLQGSLTLGNIHRAKRHGDTLIIVEASFDGTKVHQAGHPNVVALLKGALSKAQANLIERTFNNVVISVDNDSPMDYTCQKCFPRCMGHPPGAQLAYNIYKRLGPTTNVYAVPFSLYHGKDASDMTEDEEEDLKEKAAQKPAKTGDPEAESSEERLSVFEDFLEKLDLESLDDDEEDKDKE